MEKLNAKTDGTTVDIVAQNIAILRKLFPEVFTEGTDETGPRWKVDFVALQETLGRHIEDQQERYSFNWNGKARARTVPGHRPRNHSASPQRSPTPPNRIRP